MQLTITIDDSVVAAFERLIAAHGWDKTVEEYFVEEFNLQCRQVVKDHPDPALKTELDGLDQQRRAILAAASPDIRLQRS